MERNNDNNNKILYIGCPGILTKFNNYSDNLVNNVYDQTYYLINAIDIYWENINPSDYNTYNNTTIPDKELKSTADFLDYVYGARKNSEKNGFVTKNTYNKTIAELTNIKNDLSILYQKLTALDRAKDLSIKYTNKK